MKNLVNIFTTLTLILAFGFILTVIFWCIYPYNPLEIKQPLEILNEDKTVQVGEQLFYQVEFTKNTDKLPIINNHLVDEVVYALAPITPVNTSGEHNQVVSHITIPTIPAGNYYLRTSTCYEMNPIRTVCVVYESENFNILE